MRLSIIIFISILLSGCAKFSHLDELLTLKAMSEDGDAQAKYVAEQDAKFEALVKEVREGTLKKGLTQKEAWKIYGDPIARRPMVKNGEDVEQWLRRYCVRRFDSDKVYLYFDKDQKLVDWEFVKYVKLKTEPLFDAKEANSEQKQ